MREPKYIFIFANRIFCVYFYFACCAKKHLTQFGRWVFFMLNRENVNKIVNNLTNTN